MFSSAGQLIYRSKIKPQEEIYIDWIDYPSDIYFIRFRNDFEQHIAKIPKIR